MVVPLIGSYPVVTVRLSVVFLGERLGAIQIGGIFLVTAGVVLISGSS